ncbi:MAG: GNAT family N-acetyltransferase [Bacteroidota bacterium]|nr:GNAT family N-acetyltransferase [Ferruginibacter sp.]
MEKVTLDLNEKGHGAFRLNDGAEELGEMVVGINGSEMTVYHTEIDPSQEGKGLAKVLLDAMVAHARENHLKVKPLCTYVAAQMKRHPDQYADVWQPAQP